MTIKKSSPLTIKEVIELLLRYPNQNTEIKAVYTLQDEIAIDSFKKMIYVDYNGYEEFKVKEDINVKLP